MTAEAKEVGGSEGVAAAAKSGGDVREEAGKVEEVTGAQDPDAVDPPPADDDGEEEEEGSNTAGTTRLYVGNLPWSATSADLLEHMSTVGEVLSADVLAGRDGRSRGCGVVEYAAEDDALRAMEELRDTDLQGRQIFVREDREEKGAQGGRGAPRPAAGGSAAAGAGDGGTAVYVGNLSYEATWKDLKDHMRGAGEVVRADVLAGRDGRSKGCGTVTYATAEGARTACATHNNTELLGRTIFVREDREGGGPQTGRAAPDASARAAGGGLAVYVGNLAFETSWQDLKDHMRAAGDVDEVDILRSKDGRSKGCGIVVYQTPDEASRAVQELQDTELGGRRIFVREDREAGAGANRGGGGGRGGRRGGGGGRPAAVVLVGNVSREAGWQDLKDHFKPCGTVARCNVGKGRGTVRFEHAADASAAVEQMHGTEFMGSVLDVRLDSK